MDMNVCGAELLVYDDRWGVLRYHCELTVGHSIGWAATEHAVQMTATEPPATIRWRDS